jgi:hypothetical protein
VHGLNLESAALIKLMVHANWRAHVCRQLPQLLLLLLPLNTIMAVVLQALPLLWCSWCTLARSPLLTSWQCWRGRWLLGGSAWWPSTAQGA